MSRLRLPAARFCGTPRTEVAEAQYDQDIAAFKLEIKDLEAEASHASDAA